MENQFSYNHKSYGKHSKMYWVVIYVIAAAVLYGLVFYIYNR